MHHVREQRDLAALPEPRFIYTAPAWLRRFAACLLACGAVLSAVAIAEAIIRGGTPAVLFVGGVGLVLSLFVLLFLHPTDWRSWINLAATPDGLYLVPRPRSVVFVPWRDVAGIDIKPAGGGNGRRNFARLTLRLPEDGWAAFAGAPGVSGTGPVRQYLLSGLGTPGEDLVARLKAFRAEHA